MKVRLFHKILLSIFIASLVAMLTVMVFTHISFKWEFLDYLAEREQEQLQQVLPLLASHYQDQGNWDLFLQDRREWHELLRRGRLDGSQSPKFSGPPPGPNRSFRPGPPGQNGRPPRRQPLGNDPTQFGARIYLLDQQGEIIVGGRNLVVAESNTELPVLVNDQVVGWLGVMPLTEITTPEEQALLRSRLRALLIAGSLSLVIIVALSLWLARNLSMPIRQLADVARRVSHGDLAARITQPGSDELGELAMGFNEMATTLQSHDEQRQRWVSDIAHELRTPLAVLRGEIEAMQDNVRNLDHNALDSLHAEVQQLSALVMDLETLAQSDSGSLSYVMQPLCLQKLLSEVAAGFQPRFDENNISLHFQYVSDAHEYHIVGDEIRLRQLIHNLLENSLRYTGSNGRTDIQIQRKNNQVKLVISDSAPGVSFDSLSKLFDRLYRAEGSRNRGAGGSGLGLAIAKSIVQAHHGRISAEHSQSGGLSIIVTLPSDQKG